MSHRPIFYGGVWGNVRFQDGSFMMSTVGRLAMVALAVGVVAVFLSWPPPPLSAELASWKQSGKYFKFKHFRIFYKDDKGHVDKGPTLVILHGYPTNSYDWAKIWPALQERFSRIIAPDFLGFGFSDKPFFHDYSIFEQADIVEALLDHLRVDSGHALAHDYGDTVAQEILHRYESRKKENIKGFEIKSVCLSNGGMFPETNFPKILQKLGAIPVIGHILSKVGVYPLFKNGFGEVFGLDSQPTEQEFENYWASIRFNDGNALSYGLLHYMEERRANRERWVGSLQQATVPVHTIYGDQDVINPPPFEKHYRKLLPQAGITVLPGIGHYPQCEAPSQFSTAYFDFLKTLP